MTTKEKKAAYYQAHKAKWREYSRDWRSRNAEKAKAINRASRRRNPEKNRARCAAWRAANKERVAQYNAQWRANNPDVNDRYRETTRRCSKRWKTTNPEKVAEISIRRRARMFGAVPFDRNQAMIDGVYAMARRVTKCTGIQHEVDHIIALARGGFHDHRNLQVLPGNINRLKGAKIAA